MFAMRSALLILVISGFSATASTADPPFTNLIPGYTQELYAVYPGLLYGVAFAPDGDPISIVSTGFVGGSVGLVRFDAQSTTVVNGEFVHPVAATLAVPNSQVGGLVSHPDGRLYLATGQGRVHLEGATGTVLAGPVASSRVWQLAVDPTDASRLVGSYNGSLIEVDAATLVGTPHVIWSGGQVALLDVAIDVSGASRVVAYENLALLPLTPRYRIDLVDPVSQYLGISASLPDIPHQVALFDGLSNIIVQLYTGGLMRADLAAQTPGTTPATPFATSGFQGNGLRLGPDGCLYAVQYDGYGSSIARICPESVPTQVTTWGRLKGIYR